MRKFIWVQVILGFWILLSPWILDFSFVNPARWSNVIAGVLILLSSLWFALGEDSNGRGES